VILISVSYFYSYNYQWLQLQTLPLTVLVSECVEMHRHTHWEGISGTSRRRKGHIQLFGLTILVARVHLGNETRLQLLLVLCLAELHF